MTNPLLVSLVDGIHGVLDGDTLQIAGGNLHSQRKVQVNSLNRRFRQVDLEDARVINGVGALVDFPVTYA